jgi:two-component system, OmpR family, sensor kinase
MRAPARTLYWQIAGLYLGLMLIFCAISAVLAVRQLDGFFGEVEQRLHRELSARLIPEVVPSYRSVGPTGAAEAAKHIKDINPSVDLYLLSQTGHVVASFNGKPPTRTQVSIAPIQQFLAKSARLPIRGEDPGAASGDKVFSVAPVPARWGGGYLYVVLPGMPFQSTAHMVRTSYILRGAGGLLLLILLTTLIAGLGLIFLLTRRFHRLTQVVKKFQGGAYEERAVIDSRDQIGLLAATFNEMAATIESQFKALKQTDDARRALAHNISHDFRTPLTALRGFTDRLLRADDRLTEEDRRQHLAAVLKSAAQLEHLADQLSTIVNLDPSNDHSIKVETLSIAELAQDSIVKFTALAQQRGVALLLEDPERVPLVMGDIALLERALSNLIDNAIHNTPPRGTVTISLPVTDHHVTIRIKDTGCGIAVDELPHLTQRFFRTARSKADKVQGTGLGLAIVDEIVCRHGSDLKIDSQLGAGTTVSFSLMAA